MARAWSMSASVIATVEPPLAALVPAPPAHAAAGCDPSACDAMASWPAASSRTRATRRGSCLQLPPRGRGARSTSRAGATRDGAKSSESCDMAGRPLTQDARLRHVAHPSARARNHTNGATEMCVKFARERCECECPRGACAARSKRCLSNSVSRHSRRYTHTGLQGTKWILSHSTILNVRTHAPQPRWRGRRGADHWGT